MNEKQVICGIHFDDLRLFISFEGFQIVIEGWPVLKAWKKTDNGEWKTYSPTINLAQCQIEYLGADEFDCQFRFLSERLENNWKRPLQITPQVNSILGYSAEIPESINPLKWENDNRLYIRNCLKNFFETIPDKVKNAVSQIEWNQWQILKWAKNYDGLCNLLEINSALALGICFASRFVHIGGRKSKSFYEEILHKKQREIAAFLGFPNREATASILKKISPDCLRAYEMIRLRDILNSSENLFKVLCHTQKINQAVFYFLNYSAQNPAIGNSLTASFLNEISESFPRGEELIYFEDRIHPNGREFYRNCHLFSDLVNHLGPVRVNSIEELRRRHERMVDEQREKMVEHDTQFPPPPIHGSEAIQYIASTRELVDEGKAQENCVTTYADRIFEKDIFVYRVLAPERATLSIRKNKGYWKIDQLYCANNESVANETRKVITKWLKENQRKNNFNRRK